MGERSRLRRLFDEASDWLVAGRDLTAATWRRLRPHPLSTDEPHPECSQIPIVLLPGILEPWTYLSPLARWLQRHGHPVHFVETLGWNLASIESSTEHCLHMLQEREVRGAVLVAHSKGGLIGKAVLARAGDTTAGLVAVATPFTGSTLGGPLQRLPALSLTPLGMFLPGSPQLTALAAELAVNARIVSLAPLWDQVIPGGSHLEGATNIQLEVPGHFRPIGDERAWRVIHDHVHRLADQRAETEQLP